MGSVAPLRSTVVAALAALCLLPTGASAVVLDIHHSSTAVSQVGGGTGLVSPGNSFNVTETVVSSDPVGNITNVSGTVSTSTPNVTVTQPSSLFPAFSFGTTSANSTPFGVQIGSAVQCGQNVDLSLGLTADQGTATVPFSIGTGTAAAPVDYTSADVPHGIPDASVMTSTLPITATGRVKGISVHIGRITHTYDGDLRMTLIAPDGTRVLLVDQRGAQGQNFVDTWLTADQGSPIGGGSAPFTGTYVADGDLSQLVGHSLQGTWQLEVRDMSAGNVGTLEAWGLRIATATCAAQPIASFTATPSPALPGSAVQFDASGSHDPVGTLTRYEWDFNGDGIFEVDGGSSPTTSHVFAAHGAYPVSLRVTDNTGLQNVYTRTVSVSNPPTAALTATPVAPYSGDAVTLDASASTDPQGPIANFKWDLNGDGIFETDTGTNAITQTTFATPGAHTVRVMVTNVDGATATKTLSVTILNRPPTAVIATPPLGIAGKQLTLDGSGSRDPDGTIVDYKWDLNNDGIYETDTGQIPTVSTTFNSAGMKTVGLQVTDNDGATATTTITFKVANTPVAVLSATPNPARPNQTVTLDAGGSSDPGGSPLTFKWDLDGNGTFETATGSTPTVARVWSAGDHMITVQVSNADGVTAVATKVVSVVNQPPVAALVLSGSAVAGRPVTLDASGSADPDGTIVRYEWDLDGNGSFETNTGPTPTATHTYAAAGTIPVKVRVTDNDGAVATTTLSLAVQPGGGGTGGTGGTGSPAPGDFSAGLTGPPIQAIKLARRTGPMLVCSANRAMRCTLTATIDPHTAKQLRLARVRKPAVIGRVVIDVPEGGDGQFILRLTSAARKALRRARRVSMLVRGTAVDAGGHTIALARVVLLR